MDLPNEERRKLLEDLELEGVALANTLLSRGRRQGRWWKRAASRLEGVIAKQLGSRYEPGRRSGAWLKVKNRPSQDVVVGGWLRARGGARPDRVACRGLLRGTSLLRGPGGHRVQEGDLVRLAELLTPLRRKASPFSGSRQPPKGVVFAEPNLVVEVEFANWTRTNNSCAPPSRASATTRTRKMSCWSAPEARQRLNRPNGTILDGPAIGPVQ